MIRSDSGRRVLIIATLALWAIILTSIATYGYRPTMRLWRVPTMPMSYGDFRLIPGAAESLRLGLDPTINNPGDPLGRLFNYPAAWYPLLAIGITQADVFWLATAMIVLFFAAAWAVPDQLGLLGAVGMLLILFSPAAMLLYDRGNVDALIFVICVVAILALDSSHALAAGAVMAAAMLKIYPIVGVILWVDRGVDSLKRWSTLIVAGFAIYAALTVRTLATVWKSTMRGAELSYGAATFVSRFPDNSYEALVGWLPRPASRAVIDIGPYVLAALVMSIAIAAGLKTRSAQLRVASGRNVNAFRFGATIYLLTFYFGNNWDYRLIFLLLVMPQLAEWILTLRGWVRWWALSAAAAVLITCWYLIVVAYCPCSGVYAFEFDEAIDWFLFAVLAYLLARSMPSAVGSPAAGQVVA